MKKLTALILALVMTLSIAGCTADNKPDNSQSSDLSQTITDESKPEINTDPNLLQLLEDLVNTTQPGTAGTGLKAVKAAKDLLDWAKDNIPEPEVISKTVEQFFEDFEYKEEAVEAFDSICHIFDELANGKAEDLLNSVGLSMEDFEISPEVKENIEKLMDEIELYRQDIKRSEE